MLATWNDRIVAVALILAWLPTGWLMLALIDSARKAWHKSHG